MATIWAVARQMISEGIRMKIALVFLVLLGLVVVGLPFSIAGDSSLTGAVQSFMSYSFTAVSFLLAILTIFLSRSLSDELVNRQILLVMTKPVPRWKYVLGKWLGITVLNAVFLASAGLIVYGMVYYLKAHHPALEEGFDKQQLEHEVLVARHATKYQVPDFKREAELEYERNLEQGVYDDRPDFDKKHEIERLQKVLSARWQIVPPLGTRLFEFKNILVDRSEGHYIQFQYKSNVTRPPPDEILRAVFRFGNPYKGAVVRDVKVRHRVDRWQTIRVPADVVAPDNTLAVQFFNQNPYPNEPQSNNIFEIRKSDDISVLFVVGSFGWNMVRLLCLIMCKLMFLAAVAILMTTVFSFPVACLGAFTVYVLAAGQSFILDGLDQMSNDYATMFSSLSEFFLQSTMHLLKLVGYILPNFARYDAVETFVNGHNVGLVWVLQAILEVGLLKTGIVLGLAVLLFHRREVAEVSV